MRSYLTLVALIGVIPLAYAEPQELSTSCSYCTTADQFAVHGAAALDVVEGNEPIYQRILAIKPITVHNTATGKAAKVNVGLDLSSSVALFIFSFGIPSTTGVVADAEFLDGSGTISRKVSNQLIARMIREKGIKPGDVASCRRSDCAKPASVDLSNLDIGIGNEAGHVQRGLFAGIQGISTGYLRGFYVTNGGGSSGGCTSCGSETFAPGTTVPPYTGPVTPYYDIGGHY